MSRQARLISLLGLALHLVCSTAWTAPTSNSDLTLTGLTRIEQVKQLTRERAREGLAVRVEVVVSYYDPSWGLLFVHDHSGGIAIDLAELGSEIPVGEWVRLEARTEWSESRSGPVLTQPIFQAAKGQVKPAARPLKLEEVNQAGARADLVEITGIVRSIEERQGRVVYNVVGGGERVGLMIFVLPQGNRTDLVGARIQARGVSCGALNERPELTGIRLLVPTLNELVVLEKPEAAFAIPLESATELSSLGSHIEPNRRIRLQGVVVDAPPGHPLLVSCGTNRVTVKTTQTSPVRPGVLLDVVAFPAHSEGASLTVEDAIYRRIGLVDEAPQPSGALASTAPDPAKALPLLTSTTAVRDLNAIEAKRGYPVRLRGVLTYYDPQWNMMFFQGATEGIYVDTEGQNLDVATGDLVVLHGESGPGGFAPQIQRPRLEILGQAPMPPAHPCRFEEMITGKEDSQWIETSGVVRAMRIEENHLWLEIEAPGGGRFRALIPQFGNRPMPSELVDAQVRLLGVCASQFNPSRQILGVELYVPRLASYVLPLEGDASLVATRPPVPIHSLLQFQPRSGVNHRVKVQGTVTLQLTRGQLFIQDDAASLLVQSPDAPVLVPGDRVEAIGFPVPGGFGPALQNATVRKLENGPALRGVAVTAAEALRTDGQTKGYDARLVQIDADLVDYLRSGTDNVLVLQDGALIFNAQLELGHGSLPARCLRRGCRLRLSGICSVQVDEDRQPRTFRLLLRSPGDVKLLQAPPWWTHERLLRVLLVMGVVMLGGAIWALALKREVQRKTAVVRQRLEKEAALEKRFCDLVEHATDMIYSHDLAGSIISINPAGERLVGYSASEIIGRNLSAFVPPDQVELALRQQQRKVEGEARTVYELEYCRRDGQRVVVEVSSWLLRQNGRVVGVQGIARDITEKRKLEAQLLRSQRMESIGTLASGIAHDLNNILAPVMIGVEMLRPNVRAQEDLEILSVMEGAVRRGANIIRQVLTFARGVQGQRLVIEPAHLVNEVIAIAQETFPRDIVIERRIGRDLWQIKGDPTQLHQVLLNLAVNARDAMPSGGTLRFAAENLFLAAEDLDASAPKQPGLYVVFEVKDTGTGIAPEIVDRIFEPFFTTKPQGKGTGLGLSTAAGIVQSHEGTLRVYTDAGRGTLFKVYIPALTKTARPPDDPLDKVLAQGRGELILVVDDEAAIRTVTRGILEHHGYRVTLAGNGKEALSAFAQNAEEIRLVLTDLMMPIMDGRSLARVLKQIAPQMRVVGSSGLQQPQEETSETLGEFAAFLNKPYTATQLIETIERCLSVPS